MGILDKIFGKPRLQLQDYSVFKADMHSHLIPGIDDGARTIEDSIALIKELRALGFSKLITTPHIMSDFYRNTPEIILEGLEKVKERIKAENIDVTIEAAAEYYLDSAFAQKLQKEKILSFGKKFLLFEISYINYPENFKEIVFDIQTQGYTPVLAHPERYPFWYNDFNEYFNIRNMGMLIQINVNSLSGYYGPQSKAIAEKLVDNNLVDLIGTDCHNMKHIAALKKTLYAPYLKKLSEQTIHNSNL
jgi:tyrosine-protein phosphatase YwqE